MGWWDAGWVGEMLLRLKGCWSGWRDVGFVGGMLDGFVRILDGLVECWVVRWDVGWVGGMLG